MKNKIRFDDCPYTPQEIADKAGITRKAAINRIYKYLDGDMDIDDILLPGRHDGFWPKNTGTTRYEFMKNTGIKSATLRKRIMRYRRGEMSLKTLLSQVRTNERVETKLKSGKEITLRQIAECSGISLFSAYRRAARFKSGQISEYLLLADHGTRIDEEETSGEEMLKRNQFLIDLNG